MLNLGYAVNHQLSTGSLAKLMAFLFWNMNYFTIVEHAPNKSPEWCCRMLTLLHGSFCILGGLTQCKWRTITPWHLTRRLLPCQYMLMLWSWGYFAFDLLWCLVYWPSNYVMLCHHVTALFAITRYMQKNHTGCTFACTMVLMELTNPLLQARWFLKKGGYGDTMLYFIVEVLYLVMFLVLRGVLGTYLMFLILSTDYCDWEGKLFSVLFYVVSMVFVYDIAGYICHRYKNEIDEVRQYYYATHIPEGLDVGSRVAQAEIIEAFHSMEHSPEARRAQETMHGLQTRLGQETRQGQETMHGLETKLRNEIKHGQEAMQKLETRYEQGSNSRQETKPGPKTKNYQEPKPHDTQ